MKNFSFIIEKLKLNKDKPLLRSLSLLLATLLLLSVAVWAWFSMNEKADANGLNITMGTSKNLLLSLNNKDYFTGIDLLDNSMKDYISETNKLDDLKMRDITSDGKTFLRPTFTQTDNIREPNTAATENWSTPDKNKAYISEFINFRTTFPADIYMGAGTDISTECEDKGYDLTGSSTYNKSTDYGDFSKDCIVGALRISAVDTSGNLLFTMIPRSDIELVIDGDSYSVNTGDAVSEEASIHKYYDSNKAPQTNNDVLTSFSATADSKPEDETTKLTTTTYNSTTGYYEGSATVNIWLEGCDAETRRALSGGKYSIILDFVAYEIVEATEASTSTE